MVSPSSCALETMPRPLRNATTGASINSASSRISSRASMAPLPTKIIGVLLPAINAAAAVMRSLSGCGAGNGSNGFAAPVSARCELIRHLMEMAAALAEELRRHLSGQTQYRFVRSECSEQGCTGIKHARAGHHAEHAGPAGGPRIAVGHVAAGLLVARADHL